MCDKKPSEGISRFTDFVGTAIKPGAIDDKTKEMIILALSLGVQCKPCTDVHIKKASDMGITMEEMEEIASLGVMFGGIKSMMLWKEAKENIS